MLLGQTFLQKVKAPVRPKIKNEICVSTFISSFIESFRSDDKWETKINGEEPITPIIVTNKGNNQITMRNIAIYCLFE